jgi:hypothetical protein
MDEISDTGFEGTIWVALRFSNHSFSASGWITQNLGYHFLFQTPKSSPARRA